MFCIRYDSIWYCVKDSEYFDFIGKKHATIKEKDDFIKKHGTKYKKDKDNKYIEDK